MRLPAKAPKTSPSCRGRPRDARGAFPGARWGSACRPAGRRPSTPAEPRKDRQHPAASPASRRAAACNGAPMGRYRVAETVRGAHRAIQARWRRLLRACVAPFSPFPRFFEGVRFRFPGFRLGGFPVLRGWGSSPWLLLLSPLFRAERVGSHSDPTRVLYARLFASSLSSKLEQRARAKARRKRRRRWNTHADQWVAACNIVLHTSDSLTYPERFPHLPERFPHLSERFPHFLYYKIAHKAGCVCPV